MAGLEKMGSFRHVFVKGRTSSCREPLVLSGVLPKPDLVGMGWAASKDGMIVWVSSVLVLPDEAAKTVFRQSDVCPQEVNSRGLSFIFESCERGVRFS